MSREVYPTFRYCPECGEMVITDGVSFWCESETCDWSQIQAKIEFPSRETDGDVRT